jgi:hypothetical protein
VPRRWKQNPYSSVQQDSLQGTARKITMKLARFHGRCDVPCREPSLSLFLYWFLGKQLVRNHMYTHTHTHTHRVADCGTWKVY